MKRELGSSLSHRIRTQLERDLRTDPGILILAYPYARTWSAVGPERVRDTWAEVGDDPAAVYVHVPFCRRKCTFCDFLAYYGRPAEEMDSYVRLVCAEIDLVAPYVTHVEIDAVHIGGGTPSLLTPSQLGQLLDALRGSFRVRAGAQVTMEAFPDERITLEEIKAWRDLGINRLSYGIQFFDDELKREANRTDTTTDNLRLIENTLEAGFDDVNLDLMCGMPNQPMASWEATLDLALELKPSHVCIFPVSVRHPGIPLFRKRDTLPPPDETRRMWNTAATALRAAGYTRTTRHNFMRPGFKYRYEHMIAHLAPLIALGANSVGYSMDCIYRNHSGLARYAAAIQDGLWPVRAAHFFVGTDRLHNYAVRRIEYLRLYGQDFGNRFGMKLEDALPTQIETLVQMGLARLVNQNLFLTEDGVYYTSAVKRALFHPSAWDRFEGMAAAELTLERSTLTQKEEPERCTT